jgi:hypothetical protein
MSERRIAGIQSSRDLGEGRQYLRTTISDDGARNLVRLEARRDHEEDVSLAGTEA